MQPAGPAGGTLSKSFAEATDSAQHFVSVDQARPEPTRDQTSTLRCSNSFGLSIGQIRLIRPSH